MIEIINALKNKANAPQPSLDERIDAAVQWLARAQDVTSNDGVSIRYSLFKKWGSSYPETTGYIIPTFLKYFDLTGNSEYKERAIRMGLWEVSIQQEDGSFIGGAYEEPVGKLIFDTGQIIYGLLWAYTYSKNEVFLDAAISAGDWLVSIQDNDGYWQRYSFQTIPHVYHSRVAWALAQLYSATHDEKYLSAVIKHVKWVLSNQAENGWFRQAGFTIENHNTPYTHTIAYTIRGLLEIGILLEKQDYIDAAIKSSDAILSRIEDGGYLWGSYNSSWESTRKFSCLTGNAQIAIIFLRIYQLKKETKYLDSAKEINNYLKLKQFTKNENSNIYGAIPGSWPIWGEYERFSYPNWATKFFLDSLMLENHLTKSLVKNK